MKLCNNKFCILLIRSKRGVSVFIYSGFIRKWINLLSRSVCVIAVLHTEQAEFSVLYIDGL